MFGAKPTINIKIDGNPKFDQYKQNQMHINLPLYTQGDAVTGHVTIEMPAGKSLSHQGILVILQGEFKYPDGTVISPFFTRKQEIVPQGEITSPISSDFRFDNFNFPCCSYAGSSVSVNYIIQVRIVKRLIDIKQESEFAVVFFTPPPSNLEPVHNEVGIRNILHIEFVFPQNLFDCTGCVIGAVYFILVKLRIVHMQLNFYRIESYNSDDTVFKKKTLLKQYEIMDGPPVRGECIPIRLFLSNEDIWPFVPFKGCPLHVEHYIRAQLTDENGKGYFKRLKIDFQRYPH